jgi:hypothetical protein
VYTFYYKVDGVSVVDNNVSSPFFDFSSNGAPNTEYLEVEPDLAPEDGWELLYENIGGPVTGTSGTEFVDVPTFALYNRYSGQIRILVYHPSDNSNSFDIMNVTASNWNARQESVFESGNALFSYMETPSKALDRFDAFGNLAASYNRYVDGGVWSTLDYVVAYDPCVCEYPSRVYVETILQDTQTINLQLTGTALTEPQVQAGIPASSLQQGFKFAGNGFGVLGAGLTSFNKLDSYYAKVREWQESGENASSYSNAQSGSLGFFTGPPKPALNILGEVLPGWLSLGRAAVELLKFFTGSKGAGSPARITGYTTTFNLDIIGSQTNTDFAIPSSFNTPSSEAQNSSNFQSGSNPVYGNPLGVFNLVRTPEIRHRVNVNSGDISRVSDKYYSFDGNDLDYVVNTSAGFEPIPRRIMLSLVYEDCPYEVRTMRLLDQRVGGDFRTPFIDAACFENHHVNFYTDWSGGDVTGGGVFNDPFSNPGDPVTNAPDAGQWGGGGVRPIRVTDLRVFECNTRPQLQVLVTLIPSDGGEDVVFMGSYEVTIGSSENIFGALPFNGFFSDYAAAISCNSPTVPPVTVEELRSFCENEYDPGTSRSGVGPGIIKEDEKALSVLAETKAEVETDHAIFPNPFVNKLTLQLSGEVPQNIALYDLNGRLVFSQDNLTSDHKQLQLNLENLSVGSYQLQLIYENRVASSIITKTSK